MQTALYILLLIINLVILGLLIQKILKKNEGYKKPNWLRCPPGTRKIANYCVTEEQIKQ